MRKNFKHGKWVKATGIPHADIGKYVDKKTGKEIIKGEYLYYLMKEKAGKHKIVRQ